MQRQVLWLGCNTVVGLIYQTLITTAAVPQKKYVTIILLIFIQIEMRTCRFWLGSPLSSRFPFSACSWSPHAPGLAYLALLYSSSTKTYVIPIGCVSEKPGGRLC